MARHVLLVDPDGTRVDHLASVLGRVAAAPAILTFAADGTPTSARRMVGVATSAVDHNDTAPALRAAAGRWHHADKATSLAAAMAGRHSPLRAQDSALLSTTARPGARRGDALVATTSPKRVSKRRRTGRPANSTAADGTTEEGNSVDDAGAGMGAHEGGPAQGADGTRDEGGVAARNKTTADAMFKLLDGIGGVYAGVDIVWLGLPSSSPDHEASAPLIAALFHAWHTRCTACVIHPDAAVAGATKESDLCFRAWADILGCPSPVTAASETSAMSASGNDDAIDAVLGAVWRGPLVCEGGSSGSGSGGPGVTRRSGRVRGKQRASDDGSRHDLKQPVAWPDVMLMAPGCPTSSTAPDASLEVTDLRPTGQQHAERARTGAGDGDPGRVPMALVTLCSCSSGSLADVLRYPWQYAVEAHPSAPTATRTAIQTVATTGTSPPPVSSSSRNDVHDDAILAVALFDTVGEDDPAAARAASTGWTALRPKSIRSGRLDRLVDAVARGSHLHPRRGVLVLLRPSLGVSDGTLMAEVLRPDHAWAELTAPVFSLLSMIEQGTASSAAVPKDDGDPTASLSASSTAAVVNGAIGRLPHVTANVMRSDDIMLQEQQWKAMQSAPEEPADLVTALVAGHRRFLDTRAATPLTAGRGRGGGQSTEGDSSLASSQTAAWWTHRHGATLLEHLEGRAVIATTGLQTIPSSSSSPGFASDDGDVSDMELLPAPGADVLGALKGLPEMGRLRRAGKAHGGGPGGSGGGDATNSDNSKLTKSVRAAEPAAATNTADRVLRAMSERRPSVAPPLSSKTTVLAVPIERMRLAASNGDGAAVAAAQAAPVAVRRGNGAVRFGRFESVESMASNRSSERLASSPVTSSCDVTASRSSWDEPGSRSHHTPRGGAGATASQQDVSWRQVAARNVGVPFEEAIETRNGDMGVMYCTQTTERLNDRLAVVQRRVIKENNEGMTGLLLPPGGARRSASGRAARRGGGDSLRRHPSSDSSVGRGISSGTTPADLEGASPSPLPTPVPTTANVSTHASPMHSADHAAAAAAGPASGRRSRQGSSSLSSGTALRQAGRLILRDACKAVIKRKGTKTADAERVYENLYRVCRALMKVSRVQPSSTEAYAAEAAEHAEQHYDYIVDNLKKD
eukprot:m.96611 g.96611  ORF g.96611 m.96611 type:complete len:1142 (-) comp10175_c0_seq2:264-3689(-)